MWQAGSWESTSYQTLAPNVMELGSFREMGDDCRKSYREMGWKAESTASVPMALLFSETRCQLTSLCLSFLVWKISDISLKAFEGIR